MHAAAARLRAAHWLGAARLEPGARNPNAILIVRRLADPLPRRLAPTLDAVAPSAEWEHAAQTVLADCFDRAARPIDGAVPASANAVRFDDEAQLLACLARDVMAGAAAARWWWRTLFRDATSDALATVVSAWLQRPRAVPAAFAQLTATDEAVAFVQMLSKAHTRAMLVAIANAFDLPSIAAVASMPMPATASTPPAPLSSAVDGARAIETRPSLSLDAGMTQGPPPWIPIAGSRTPPPDLDADRQALLGIAIAIARAPLAVRTTRFVERFRDWRHAVHASTSAPRSAATASDQSPTPVSSRTESIEIADTARPIDRSDANTSVEHRVADSPAATASPSPVQPVGDEGRPQPIDRTRTGAERCISSAEAAVLRAAGPLDQTPESTPTVESPVTPIGRRAARIGGGESSDRRTPFTTDAPLQIYATTAASASPTLSTRTSPATAVATSLGGVLFLINALEHERVFERIAALDEDSQIGGWQWLGLIARRLLGAVEELDHDPIWSALETLDRGRADDRDASDVLDIVVPPLRDRLVATLDIAAVTPDDTRALLSRRLLLRRGRLACTATHVDLHMTMAQIDITVRLSGLDANPGWVPALGRVITFYFE